MQVMRIAVLVSLLTAGFATTAESDSENLLHQQPLSHPTGLASLMDPSLVATGTFTSYNVPYDLAYPICEANRSAEYWDENFGIPLLGTWLLVRSGETGLSTLCAVVGTFRYGDDRARLLNISPRVADALGVDVDDGLFDVVVEEYLWNVESTAATRRLFLEEPQVFFSRPNPHLPLMGLDRDADFAFDAPEDGDGILHDPMPGAPVSLDPPGGAPPPPPVGFPHFPWPAPPPSLRPVEFPRDFFSDAHTLGLFDALLDEGLRSVGYFDKSYYYVPSGFAVVTRLEQINGDATPKPDSERWPVALNVSHRWTLASYLRLLFTADVPVGYGRVLVFAVTDDDCVIASEACGGDQTAVTAETVGEWLKEGTGRLPMSMKDIALSESHAVWGIVYEFEKPSVGDPYQTFNRDHQGLTHFVRAGIWDYFDRR